MEEVINGILIREVETKNIMTKSSLPVGGYSVNPYVGCTHACKYCYASFMKRFTGHTEEWGTFLDVKHWPEIKNPKKYAGQRVVIGSVTDGYNPQEEQFMAEVINGILINEAETKNIMTKSSLPVGGYSVNPYVGCTHACKYCYASFMKRFTGHKEEWGTFLDVKHWPEIKNPKKYAGQRVVIGSVTDGYNPQEKQFGNTRKLLEQLIGSDADILICTKSDLVVRDIDLLKKLGRVTVSWSINTLDENFKNDMDSASSIERRIAAMKQVYEAGIRTVCFVSPVFPGITDFEAIFERVKDQCDLFWLENLNLRGGFKKTIMDYIAGKYPDLVPLYDEIYNKHNRSYFEALEVKAEEMAKKYDCPFVDNEMPYDRVVQGHPVIVDYFYHEEIRGTENTGKRNR